MSYCSFYRQITDKLIAAARSLISFKVLDLYALILPLDRTQLGLHNGVISSLKYEE